MKDHLNNINLEEIDNKIENLSDAAKEAAREMERRVLAGE